MKKVIALLLSLIMIVGFTACGKLSAEGQKVSAVLSGKETKTVKLTIKGDILEGTVKSIVVPVEDGNETFATGTIAKDNGKTLVVKFTSLDVGGGMVTVTCAKDNEIVCRVSFMLYALDDGKLDFGTLTVYDGEFLDFETSGENKEEAAEYVHIPVMDNDTNLIFLNKAEGDWFVGEYDATIVKPVYVGESEDGYSKYQAVAVAPGVCSVQFINTGIMKQVAAYYEVKKLSSAEPSGASGASEDVQYSVKLTDYKFLDFTSDEYFMLINQPQRIMEMQLFDRSLVIPKDVIVKGFALYNEKTSEYFVFDEDQTFGDVEIPDNIDTLNVDMEYGNVTMAYEITKAKTFDDVCKDIEALKSIESVQDLTAGLQEFRYYHTTYGFGEAVWIKNDLVKSLTFTHKNQSAEENIKIAEMFME